MGNKGQVGYSSDVSDEEWAFVAPYLASRSLPPASNSPRRLGGREPATLEGHIDAQGYTLHLTGMATGDRLEALTRALPTLGDGLAEALPVDHPSGTFHIDVTATRPWGGPQTWLETSTRQPPPHKSRR